MKVILTGSTGYIGSAVLTACLSNPSITNLILLTRRVPPITHPKIQTLLIEDFTSYPESVIKEIRTADAAIWCLGTYNGDMRIDVDLPLTFLNLIKSRIREDEDNDERRESFRYIQLGGAFTEPPPDLDSGERERNLWYFSQGRRIRGLTESKVLECEEEGLNVFVVKPGAVVPKFRGEGCVNWVLGDALSVGIEQLAGCMVELAVGSKNRNGDTEEKRVWLNKDIREYVEGL